MAVYESLQLHITADKFLIAPQNAGVSELLVIDRISHEISLEAPQSALPGTDTFKQQIYGIFGVVRLTAGPYLIVITNREKVGDVGGQTIWRVTDTALYSYQKTMLHLTEKQIMDNRTYLSMIELALKTESYYFSTTYDITHSLQRLQNTSPDFLSMPLHERADARFLWNGHLMKELTQQPELGRYCLPILLGFITVKSCNINNKPFDYILISRRCIYRAGTRFYVRGIDTEGQVANYVETEQIVQYDGQKCSLVQTRGSIPVFWKQRPNLKYKPKIAIDTANHHEVFKRHIEDQVFYYGEQVAVNLINSSGSEGQLERALSQSITRLQHQRLRYEYFDFHHECRKMRWDRLAILIDRLSEDINRFGYYMVGNDGVASAYQKGVFRTNCIDCLDRTNVVQGMIAKVVLQQQLGRLGIIEMGQKIDDFTTFKRMYNNIWADNADCISKQYAGTGALKTDFTRLGKRTTMGLLMDGWNSLIRYFKNNFSDGFRQDSIDLILGNYVVEDNEGVVHPTPLQKQRDWKFYAIPVIFVIALAMCTISILMPDEDMTEQFVYVLFWGSASIISMATMYIYGAAFIDNPKLVHTR
ncbi:phosphatidylinositide phosphatase SAC1-like [Mizuhopecten yessoensis]|uniref:Phosphatidylinositol-3-phosphatase SAC1 n=1 Tax=Mizuhopecten yessoensis TaxID=6573 RepID=A0A210PNA9_MIZYE|nr:phosphatidylinositide phosphatase SAC1-like [Mizuhopecten yessoensis]OWF37982.1 Phosphatidylinositide phosphatase SAC1 [Mizuhopecten yessoensis]